MITKESQVRLSVVLAGRLGAKASNASTKKQIKKLDKAIRNGMPQKGFKYNEPQVQEVKQSLLIGSEAVSAFISAESFPPRFRSNDWKRMKPIQRLEAHLQIIANMLANQDKAKFTYQIID